jgi:hypothetical protein
LSGAGCPSTKGFIEGVTGAPNGLDLPLRVEGIDQNIRPPFAW